MGNLAPVGRQIAKQAVDDTTALFGAKWPWNVIIKRYGLMDCWNGDDVNHIVRACEMYSKMHKVRFRFGLDSVKEILHRHRKTRMSAISDPRIYEAVIQECLELLNGDPKVDPPWRYTAPAELAAPYTTRDPRGPGVEDCKDVYNTGAVPYGSDVFATGELHLNGIATAEPGTTTGLGHLECLYRTEIAALKEQNAALETELIKEVEAHNALKTRCTERDASVAWAKRRGR